MEKKYFQNIAGNYFTHRIEMQLFYHLLLMKGVLFHESSL